jgi:vacuolar-type H+-ATPase subunit C/Vma6
MNILTDRDKPGFPTEYLLARIQGRRIRPAKDMVFDTDRYFSIRSAYFGNLIGEYPEEGVWKRMMKEYQWVYLQMNHELKNIFTPFFLHAELKTVLMILRNKTGKRTLNNPDDSLRFSLLAGDVKEVLVKDDEIPNILETFTIKFLSPACKPDFLKGAFLRNGMMGVEEILLNTFFEQLSNASLHPLIKKYFSRLIDIRNTLILYKHVRWNISADPQFIPGGTISLSGLKAAPGARSPRGEAIGLDSAKRAVMPSGVENLRKKITKKEIRDLSASEAENALLSGLTRWLRFSGREDPVIGLILDYLWNIHIEARNLSVMTNCRDLDAGVLKEEVVFG